MGDKIPTSSGVGQADPLPSSQQRFWPQTTPFLRLRAQALETGHPVATSWVIFSTRLIPLSLRLLIIKQGCQWWDLMGPRWLRGGQ